MDSSALQPELPRLRRWRDIGNGSAEISSEFTVTETLGSSAMLYAILHALESNVSYRLTL